MLSRDLMWSSQCKPPVLCHTKTQYSIVALRLDPMASNFKGVFGTLIMLYETVYYSILMLYHFWILLETVLYQIIMRQHPYKLNPNHLLDLCGFAIALDFSFSLLSRTQRSTTTLTSFAAEDLLLAMAIKYGLCPHPQGSGRFELRKIHIQILKNVDPNVKN